MVESRSFVGTFRNSRALYWSTNFVLGSTVFNMDVQFFTLVFIHHVYIVP